MLSYGGYVDNEDAELTEGSSPRAPNSSGTVCGYVLCMPLRAQETVMNEEDKEKSLPSRLAIDKGPYKTRNTG